MVLSLPSGVLEDFHLLLGIRIATFAYMERLASTSVIFLAAVAVLLVPPARACSNRCGNISIAYPFGIEPGCYHDGFNLTCDHPYHPPKLFLGDGTVEVLEMSIPDGTVRINSTNILPLNPIDGALKPNTTDPEKPVVQAQLIRYLLSFSECSGIGCCAAAIPKGFTSYKIVVRPPDDPGFDERSSSVYIAEGGSYSTSSLMNQTRGAALPAALLDWVISNATCREGVPATLCCSSSYVYDGYQCSCSAGYQGNPYIPIGCRDINECVNPEVHSCHGICINVPGTFQCQCPDGTYENASIPGGCIKIDKYFRWPLTIGNLVEIIDPQVVEEDNGEVQEVAALAAMCTRLEGEDRPTMREVEMALENLQARKKPVLNNMSSKRYDSDQIVAHYKSTEDLLARKDLSNGEDTEQASRQYTLEEEMVMSARFPR
ncbi:unnamed protein product [Urochloa decumbens]|uniref:EGF-like calcium-binding domain-containing protein n=1 Tax=Urochloa decumbens TaxID=240449 RepID=A0ABC9C1P6_9POAL